MAINNYFNATPVSIDFNAVKQVDSKPAASGFADGNIIFDKAEQQFYQALSGSWIALDFIGDDFTVNKLAFNTAATETLATGELAWNADDETVDMHVGDDVTIQLGQEMVYHVINQTGTQIDNGTVVMADGALGASGKIKVVPAIADGSVPAKYIMGVATEDIPNGALGYVTAFGKVRGFNTSSYSSGTVLYASATSSGSFTDTAPSLPNQKVTVAITLDQKSNGNIFVRPTYDDRRKSVSSISDLENVNTTENDVVYLNAGRRSGWFRWDSTDHSTATGTGFVDDDPGQGIYVAPSSDTSGASGAWVRHYEDLIPEFFGATGDGTTDDSTAFQRVINYASGERIVLEASYKINSDLDMPSAMTLEGNGKGQINTGASVNLFVVDSNQTITDIVIHGVKFSDGDRLIWIDGTVSSTTIDKIRITDCSFDGADHIIEAFSSEGYTLETLQFLNNDVRNMTGTSLGFSPASSGKPVKHALVDGNRFDSCTDSCVSFVNNGSENVTVTNNTFIECETTRDTNYVCIIEASYSRVVDNVVNGYKHSAAIYVSADETELSQNTIYANTYSGSGGTQYGLINKSTTTTIIGNRIDLSNSTFGTRIGLYLDLAGVDAVAIVDGNYIYGANEQGINCLDTGRYTITNNHIELDEYPGGTAFNGIRLIPSAGAVIANNYIQNYYTGVFCYLGQEGDFNNALNITGNIFRNTVSASYATAQKIIQLQRIFTESTSFIGVNIDGNTFDIPGTNVEYLAADDTNFNNQELRKVSVTNNVYTQLNGVRQREQYERCWDYYEEGNSPQPFETLTGGPNVLRQIEFAPNQHVKVEADLYIGDSSQSANQTAYCFVNIDSSGTATIESQSTTTVYDSIGLTTNLYFDISSDRLRVLTMRKSTKAYSGSATYVIRSFSYTP